MKKIILKLLKDTENKEIITNEWEEYFESENGDYKLKEYLDFPNFRYITSNLKENNFFSNAIKSELKRMENDGLINISQQTVKQYAERLNDLLGIPEMEWEKKIESIILTTKGKSNFKYFIYQITKNTMSFISLLISILAIIVSIFAVSYS